MSYKIKSRIWIESNQNVFLGEGRIELLKAIQKTGSLSKAAKSLNLSYKKAWHLLDAVNKSAKKPVTVNAIGGANGGGTQLTDYGKSLIVVFEDINKSCWEFLDNQLKKIEEV
ncbi:molybdenum transporter [Tenacibaculum sp. 190524A05c]|uniref:Molybdate transport system regulatory protein n=1 Tax=Tenacibaculum platacis TaxID=3137852 RepID=A0ABM9NT83_9FLAO